MEGELIRFALAHYRGQMSEMARERSKSGARPLYRKLEGLGLDALTFLVDEEGPANSGVFAGSFETSLGYGPPIIGDGVWIARFSAHLHGKVKAGRGPALISH